MTLVERLDELIVAQKDSADDRIFAYQTVKGMSDDDSAAYAYARAALAGRMAELRGAGAGKLVTEAEFWARASIERDTDFLHGAATRMLGTLYVMAPGRLLEHGDSEEGLTLLEVQQQRYPDDPRNALRVAEAYVALGDPDGAVEWMCLVAPHRASLRADDQRLYDQLRADVGELDCG